MHEDLIQVLAEPGTGEPLRLVRPEGCEGRIESGALVAPSGREYPIVRGIPRFVPSDGYADSFGRQWNKFRQVQLDSVTGCTRSRDRFDQEVGWTEAELRGQRVLDAGCGAGRFAELAAARGARLVALDLSSAVDATARTLSRYPNVDCVQGDLLQPPFRPGAFDFAYSLGVMQHTPDPAGGIASVLRCVKPGGRFAFTIYGRRPWTKLNAKYLVRPLTRRLPAPLLLRAIEAAMPVLFPVTDVLFRLPVAGRVFRHLVPVANYVENTQFSRAQRYDEAILDTFDMLAPRYDSPMTAAEVETALRRAEARAWRFVSRVPVVVQGER